MAGGAQQGPLVTDEAQVACETWSDPLRGEISFRTLCGTGDPPTQGLTAGVARLPAGGWLGRHHHAAAEVYTVLAGTGVVTVEGTGHRVGPGATVYLPGGAVHSVRNDGVDELAVFYCLAAGSMEDVVYHWECEEAAED